MYGNAIEDLGGGQFRLTNPGAKYTELDQYLMGLRDPMEVGPLFLVDIGALSAETSAFPVPKGTDRIVTGERVDFTVDDIIRAEGPRAPARDMCHWKAAFVIVHEEGVAPTADEIARVDAYRRRWEEFYADATDRRGSFDTTLLGTGGGTTECPAEVEPPPPDAGVAVPDAAPMEEDSGAPDAAIDPVEDAGERDAMPVAPDAGEEEGVRTLVTDDCSCRTAKGRGSLYPILVAAIIWAAAHVHERLIRRAVRR
jgi:hypothetical protein